ncbi:MAG: hypothetical protein HKL98_12030 [Burkholderiales bacterium]|nr:hypothetical protein [Burkholderiales bacterium]
MGQVIDDRNDEWYKFIKNLIEQDIPSKKSMDELIEEALEREAPEFLHVESMQGR